MSGPGWSTSTRRAAPVVGGRLARAPPGPAAGRSASAGRRGPLVAGRSSTRRHAVHRAEPDPRCQAPAVRAGPGPAPRARGRAAEQPPAARRCGRVHGGQAAGDGDRAGRHAQPRAVQPRYRGQHRVQPGEVGKAGSESRASRRGTPQPGAARSPPRRSARSARPHRPGRDRHSRRRWSRRRQARSPRRPAAALASSVSRAASPTRAQLPGSTLTSTVTAPGTTSITPGRSAALMTAATVAAPFPSWSVCTLRRSPAVGPRRRPP